MPSSDARARRRQRARQASKPLSTPVNEEPVDMKFFSKIGQNDTLQVWRRKQQINNHLKQHQQLSSEDEHEVPPAAIVVSPSLLRECIGVFCWTGRRSSEETAPTEFRDIIDGIRSG